MTIALDESILQPGDVLLYYKHDLVDFGISEKTGKQIGHVEIYIGNGQSVASRNGIGVNQYPLRLDDLVCVRRATEPLRMEDGLKWFNDVAKGQAYDFMGLLTFTSLVKVGTPGDEFCSEFAVNFLRACAIEILNPDQPAVCTSPRDLWIIGSLQTVWKLNDNY